MGVTPFTRARLVVLCGLVAVVAGVGFLAGYAVGLIAAGVFTTVYGLAVIDVDDKGDTSRDKSPP